MGVNHSGVDSGGCLVRLGNEVAHRILGLGPVERLRSDDLNIIVVGRLISLGVELVVSALLGTLGRFEAKHPVDAAARLLAGLVGLHGGIQVKPDRRLGCPDCGDGSWW